MSKLINRFTIGGILALFSLIVIGSAFAGTTEQQKLQDRITQLEAQIADNQNEYKGISDSLATDRAHCEMATAKETQLSRLNGMNTAKRTEIEILTNLLSDGDAVVNTSQESSLR